MAKSVESQSFKIYPLENFDGSLARRKKYQSHSPELWHYTDAAVGLETSYRTLCVMPTELATPSEAVRIDRYSSMYEIQIRTEAFDRSSTTFSGTVLILPVSGISFGETFGSAVYMGYVALKAIVQLLEIESTEVMLVLVDKDFGEHETHFNGKGEARLCSPQDAATVWPTGHEGTSISRTLSHHVQEFSDGSHFVVNFTNIESRCLNATTSTPWTRKRLDFVREFAETWDVKMSLWNHLVKKVYADNIFLLKPALLKGWFREDAEPPLHLHSLLDQMYIKVLGKRPNVHSYERSTIVLASRSLTRSAYDRCCNSKRLWLNQDEVKRAIAREFPNFETISVDFDQLSLRDTVKIMAKTRVLVGLHGSALWNVLFMYHTSGLVEFWPRGYFEAKYYNQPRFVHVSYLYAEVDEGNWLGHNAWTTVTEKQALELVSLALRIIENKLQLLK